MGELLEGRDPKTVFEFVAPYSMVIAKDRGVGGAYVWKFIEEAKASGLVKSSIEKAGLRGVVQAPPQ